jgi:hypothetical protein
MKHIGTESLRKFHVNIFQTNIVSILNLRLFNVFTWTINSLSKSFLLQTLSFLIENNALTEIPKRWKQCINDTINFANQ